jgi:hypothetical protein
MGPKAFGTRLLLLFGHEKSDKATGKKNDLD